MNQSWNQLSNSNPTDGIKLHKNECPNYWTWGNFSRRDWFARSFLAEFSFIKYLLAYIVQQISQDEATEGCCGAKWVRYASANIWPNLTWASVVKWRLSSLSCNPMASTHTTFGRSIPFCASLIFSIYFSSPDAIATCKTMQKLKTTCENVQLLWSMNVPINIP